MMQMHPKSQLIGLAILLAGIAALITSAQPDPVIARLIRVDTPETKHSTQAVEYFGSEANAFVQDLEL